MNDKGSTKKGGRKKLVNIISKLATDRLQRSENEENISVNDSDGQVDHNVIVKQLPSESRRKSKRKPEKAVKSSPNQDTITVEASDNEQTIHDISGADKVLIEIPNENLTIVKAIQSDSDFEETVENEVSNPNKEKVKKQKNHKNKNDAKEKVDIGHMIVNCTACSKSIQTKRGKFCRHPDLNTIICKQCQKFYSSGKFTKDEYGVEEFCRWCADGGQLICCDFCEKAFCKKCIKRNLGKSKLQELLEADENEKWNCFCCDPAPISAIIKLCNQIMRLQEAEKDQHSPYKNKKGREIISGPSRSERRNLLTSLSGERSVKSGAKTHSKSTKKTYSKCFENGLDSSSEDTEENMENSDNDDNIEEITVKKETDFDTTIQSDEGNVEGSDKDSHDDKELKSTKKGKSASKTKIDNAKEISSSESDAVPQRKSTVRKIKSNVNSSSEEEQSRAKKRKRAKKKIEKLSRRRIHSDSSGNFDFVQQKKGKRKTENKKFVASSDEESDKQTSEIEDLDSSEHSSSEASVKRKKAKDKKKRQVSSSSASESDSDNGVSLKKRKKQKNKIKSGRWSLRSKRNASNDSDSNSDIKNVKKSKKKVGKKKKVKRKRNQDDDEEEEEKEKSEDENVSPSKKGRKKIRKILDNARLAEATRHARQLEEERRQRLLEKTKNTVFDKPESTDVKEVVLEYKSDGTTPLLAVQEDLVHHLKPHQVEGVKFMYDCTIESVERWKKKEEGGGCILAHVMGLGKTLQIVTLVHTLYRSDLTELRRVLVVSPLNTVLNWQVEFEKWLNVDDRLDVYVLSEVSGNWNRADMLKRWMDYGGILIIGYALYRNLSQCFRVKNKRQKEIFKQALIDPGPELVVCDEGHVLRNCKSAISVAMNQIKTKRRIVLTGTPLQNNLLEYHCMVSFVKPNLLGTQKEFSNSFIRPIQNGQCADSTVYDVKLMKKRCHVLHRTLEGCVQRKDYSEISRYLPPKFEYVIKVRLSAKQREMYRYYLDTFLDEDKRRGATLFSDYQALMRIWTHPWSLKLESERLRNYNFDDSDDDSLKDFVVSDEESDEEESDDEEMLVLNDTETPSSSDSSCDSDDDRRRKRSKRTSKKEDKSEPEIAYGANKRKSKNQADKEETAGNIKIDPDGPSTSKAFVVVDDDDDDIAEVKPVVNGKTVDEKNGVSTGNRQLRSGNEINEPSSVTEEEWYDKFLTEDDENNIELGSKIVLLLEILADAAALDEKVLVFSHSLISLDVIEMALGGGEIGGNSEDWCRGCDYFRMDGSTSAQMRKRWADIFNDEENKSARLFLISTKAGGLGINLIGASRVVVFDISWNPSHDVQSIFRAYRFGQDKPVFVYRFIAEGTMEEKIYDRQVTKLSMSQRVVDEHQIQRHFNASDLAELYRFEPDVLENEDDKRPTPVVPKDAVLAELINRLYPKWIVKYHEHDSLLQNRPDEDLTEAERKEAWEHWELEKKGILNGPSVNMEQMQQMANGVQMPNPVGASAPNPSFTFTHGGVRIPVPAPHNVPPGQPNYAQMVMEEHRRRLYAMEKLRMQEEAQRRAHEQVRRIQQQQQEQRRRQEEEEKRAREARRYAEIQRQRQEQELKRQEEERKRQEQQQQRQRQEQQRRLTEEQERLRQQQEQLRQQQEMRSSQQFLQRLLRDRNGSVTQQVQPGNPGQSVFRVVLNNENNNFVRPQRPRRSPPRIIELPPDA